jgi:uncharacterized protein
VDVPLFPLHAVLCPGIALPLHIFEPRYRAMVNRCLADDAPFGVVWIRDGREVGAGDLAIASVGTFAEIREADRLADGRYDVVAIGTGRFRVEEVFADRETYLVARVDPVAERVTNEPRARRLSRLVTRRFVRYVARVREVAAEDDRDEEEGAAEDLPLLIGPTEDEVGPDEPGQALRADEVMAADEASEPLAHLAMPADPTLISHLLAGIVELDLPHRQALLEADTTDERLVDLANVLAREIAYLEQRLRVFAPNPGELAARRN